MTEPYLRYYVDPYEGFMAQIAELRGLARVVPPLVEADRAQRWDELGKRPGDPDVDMVDIYAAEAGPEEGYGHAKFDRLIYITSIVTGWELFREYLSRELVGRTFTADVAGDVALRTLVEEEAERIDSNFEKLKGRYRAWHGIQFGQLKDWAGVNRTHILRHALVHNQGLYTAKYLALPGARRPTKDDLFGFKDPNDDAELIDEEQIPLDEQFVRESLGYLASGAAEVRSKLGSSTISPSDIS